MKVITTDFDYKVPAHLVKDGSEVIINVSASSKVSCDKVIWVDTKLSMSEMALARISNGTEVAQDILKVAEEKLQAKLDSQTEVADPQMDKVFDGWFAGMEKQSA